MSTPWTTTAPVMALRAWRDADLLNVARVIDAACEEWERDWAVPLHACVVRAAAAGDLARAEQWHTVGGGNHGHAWLRWGEEEDERLAAGWFDGADAGTPVVRELVEACRTDLVQRLARALGIAPGTGEARPAADLSTPWSGALTASLACGGRLLIDARVVKALEPGRVPAPVRSGLVGVGKAMAQAALSLRVELQGCELSLGALQSFRAGDVLRIPHPIGLPTMVVDERGNTVFRGWLARSQGRRAVELAALDGK